MLLFLRFLCDDVIMASDEEDVELCYDQFEASDKRTFLLRAYSMCYIYLFRQTAPLTIGRGGYTLVPKSSQHSLQEATFPFTNDSLTSTSVADELESLHISKPIILSHFQVNFCSRKLSQFQENIEISPSKFEGVNNVNVMEVFYDTNFVIGLIEFVDI